MRRSRGNQLQRESYEANQKELPKTEVDHLKKEQRYSTLSLNMQIGDKRLYSTERELP